MNHKYKLKILVQGDESVGIQSEKHEVTIDFNDDGNELDNVFYEDLVEEIVGLLQDYYENGTKSFVSYTNESEDYDPTPYCHICDASVASECKCNATNE